MPVAVSSGFRFIMCVGEGVHASTSGVSTFVCVLACGGLGLMLSVSLNYFPPCCLREGISLNLELMNLVRLAGQPASPGDHHPGSVFP